MHPVEPKQKAALALNQFREMNPGEQAQEGTSGTGENVCPICDGKGHIVGHPCDNCEGTGKASAGIGGA